MSAEVKKEIGLEIGHVLFLDIVGYSKLLINEQSEQMQKLREIVRGTEQFRSAEAQGKLLRLPAGDGGALVFRTSPEAPVLCAVEISKELKSHPELRVRMGIHSGPVNEITDLNEQANIAGAGINVAQRVMDCGDAGHILLSKRVADDLAQDRWWHPYFHDLGECPMKHGVSVFVVNLYTDKVGNPQLPEKIKAAQEEQAAQAAASRPPPSALPAMSSGLDEFDLKLLDAVQRNNRLTAHQLAEKVRLSSSAVRRRLQRLRDRKIIEADVAVVSPEAVGQSLIAIVEVTLDTHHAKILEDFGRAIKSAPQVVQGYSVAGNVDFILIVTAKSMENYNAFTYEFLSKKAHVKTFNTIVVMRRVKWGIAVPTMPLG